MSDKLTTMLQEQARVEAFNAQNYEALRWWCKDKMYTGSEKFFKAAAKEELTHRDAFLDLLSGFFTIHPESPEVKKLTLNPGSLKEAFEAALQLEVDNLDSISELQLAAESEKNRAVYVWLNDYVIEQVNAITELNDILARLDEDGDNIAAVRISDKWIGHKA